MILGYLAARKSTAEILAEFPDLSEADITAALDYARDLADFESAASTRASRSYTTIRRSFRRSCGDCEQQPRIYALIQ